MTDAERTLLEAELAGAEAKARVLRERLAPTTSPAPPVPSRPVRRSMLRAPEKRPSDTTLQKAASIVVRHGGNVD